MVADAVDIEPVSASISLVAGKNRGNSADSEQFGELRQAFTWENQRLTLKFPTYPSREVRDRKRELNSSIRVPPLRFATSARGVGRWQAIEFLYIGSQVAGGLWKADRRRNREVGEGDPSGQHQGG
jgi:hypothetical protein